MPDDFDPYYHWLGIPPEEQPPSYYQLLGLRAFEDNREVISNAYDQRMAHIRTFQSGERSAASQQILRELARAGSCLLDEAKKRSYDHQLAKEPPAAKAPEAKPGAVEAAAASTHGSPPVPLLDAWRGLTSQQRIGLIVGAVVVAVILLGWSLGGGDSGDPQPAVAQAGATTLEPGAAASGVGPETPSPVPLGAPEIPPASPSPETGPETGPEMGPDPFAVTPTVPATPAATVGLELPEAAADPSDPPNPLAGSDDAGVGTEPLVDTFIARPSDATAGSQGRYGLRFTGRESVELAETADLLDLSKPFTVELWYRPEAEAEGWLLGNCAYGGSHPDLETTGTVGWQLWHIDRQEVHRVGVATGRGVMGDIVAGSESWRHLAFCGDGRRVTVFSDGRRAIVQPLELLTESWLPSPLNLHLGTHGYLHASQPAGFVGAIRGLRVSGACLYEQNFAPPEVVTVEPETKVLLDFDYPQRDRVRDLSGHGHHAEIRGARWIGLSVDAPALAQDGANPPAATVTVTVPPPTSPDPAAPPKVAVGPAKAESGHAVPSDEEQQAGRTEIRKIFENEFAAATTDEARLTLARKLEQLADESRDDPSARFVLLKEAQQLALEAGGLAAALPVLETIARDFAIDEIGEKRQALTTAARDLKTAAERQRFTDLALEVLDEALLESRMDAARQILQLAQAQASRTVNSELRRAVRDARQETDRAEKSYDAFQKAEKRLETEPENAELWEVWGRHRALQQRQWESALPALAKSPDPVWAQAAQADLARPTDAEAQAQVADHWWDLAESETVTSPRERVALRLRAHHWYRQALPQAAGLTKVRAAERIDQMKGLVADTPAVMPAADALAGPNRQALPPDIPAPQAGLIGRLTLNGKDVGLLFKYRFGFGFSHAAIADLLEQQVPRQALQEALAAGPATLLFRFLGTVRLAQSTEVLVQLEGGTAESVHSLSIDGKALLQSGGKHPVKSTVRLTLAKGEHSIGWELQGRYAPARPGGAAPNDAGLAPGGDAGLGSCRLTLTNARTGQVLASYHGGPLLNAATRFPFRATVEMSD